MNQLKSLPTSFMAKFFLLFYRNYKEVFAPDFYISFVYLFFSLLLFAVD